MGNICLLIVHISPWIPSLVLEKLKVVNYMRCRLLIATHQSILALIKSIIELLHIFDSVKLLFFLNFIKNIE